MSAAMLVVELGSPDTHLAGVTFYTLSKRMIDLAICMGYIVCMNRLLDQFRKAIAASSKSRYRLWQETGIHQSALSRLMAGKQGIGHDGLERLADALGMEIVLRTKRPEPQQSEK